MGCLTRFPLDSTRDLHFLFVKEKKNKSPNQIQPKRWEQETFMTQMVNAPIDHNLILFNCHTFVQNAKLTTKIHSLIIIIIIIIIIIQ